MTSSYSKEIEKTLALTFILTLVLMGGYISFEPQLTNAVSANDSVVITLTVDAGITITSPADTPMSRNLGVAVHTAVASTTWNVKTNNSLGYTLAVKSSTDPAMKSGSLFINDYVETVSGTPETWSVPSGVAEFGYSAYGTDVPTGTWGTGSSCQSAAHVNSTTLKYIDLDITDKTISTRSSTTTPTGVDSTVCYAVEQNNFYVPSGVYTATVTATATTL